MHACIVHANAYPQHHTTTVLFRESRVTHEMKQSWRLAYFTLVIRLACRGQRLYPDCKRSALGTSRIRCIAGAQKLKQHGAEFATVTVCTRIIR